MSRWVGRPSRRVPGGVGRPFRSAESEREALPDGWERWGRPPGGLGGREVSRSGRLGGVERPSWRVVRGQEGSRGPFGVPGGVVRPSWKAGRCRVALSVDRDGPVCPPGGPARVERSSRWASSGWVDLLVGQVGSGHPLGGTGGASRPSSRAGWVGRLSWRAGTGREAFTEDRDWSRNPPGGSGWIGRPSRRDWTGRQSHWGGWDGLGGPPSGPGLVGMPS